MQSESTVVHEDGGSGRGRRITLWILGALAVLGLIAFFVMFGPPRLADTFASPEFCGSCHEMEPWLAGFQESGHAELESCNDCHLPHGSVVEYYFWEGVVGVRDLVKHSVGAIPETIEARDRSRGWVQENCNRCHADDIEQDHDEGREYCWACHDDVYHEVDQGASAGRREHIAQHSGSGAVRP